MLYHGEVGLDSITNYSSPGFTNKEWSVFFTEAQEELIKSRLNPKGNKYQESFEETEKRSLEFSELIESTELNPFKTTILSSDQTGVYYLNGLVGYMWELPNDFFYSLKIF
jgi:hypothetical protein